METKKDLMMYYQTCLRNIGLYTSLSFAALGYSRFYRQKDAMYNIYMIIVSIIFTVISLTVSVNLLYDIEKFQKKLNSIEIKKWINIPRIIIVFNIGSLLLAFITFYSEVSSENNIKDLKYKFNRIFN